MQSMEGNTEYFQQSIKRYEENNRQQKLQNH